ncbi:MAG: hypothetical protein ACRDH2_02675, partial [Anaerolineales bacterium]
MTATKWNVPELPTEDLPLEELEGAMRVAGLGLLPIDITKISGDPDNDPAQSPEASPEKPITIPDTLAILPLRG